MPTKLGDFDFARVKKIEHQELVDQLTEAAAVFSGWADRLASTPGGDARYLLKELDAVATRARAAIVAVTVTLNVNDPTYGTQR